MCMLRLLTLFMLSMEAEVTEAETPWCRLRLWNSILGSSKSESELESNTDKSVAFFFLKLVFFTKML